MWPYRETRSLAPCHPGFLGCSISSTRAWVSLYDPAPPPPTLRCHLTSISNRISGTWGNSRLSNQPCRAPSATVCPSPTRSWWIVTVRFLEGQWPQITKGVTSSSLTRWGTLGRWVCSNNSSSRRWWPRTGWWDRWVYPQVMLPQGHLLVPLGTVQTHCWCPLILLYPLARTPKPVRSARPSITRLHWPAQSCHRRQWQTVTPTWSVRTIQILIY